jgi:hypothetical protein
MVLLLKYRQTFAGKKRGTNSRQLEQMPVPYGQRLIEALPAGGMHQYFEEIGAVLQAVPLGQQALRRVDEKYGIIAVGPPLAAEEE